VTPAAVSDPGRASTADPTRPGSPVPSVPGSVDPDEVAYYERLAHLWWDRQGPFWPLHRLNALRVGYIRDVACAHLGRPTTGPAPLAGVTVLDIGCGGGILSEAMAALGATVHGVDPTPRNIAVATRHLPISGLAVRYEATTAEALAERGERYDLVLNMEVVEHVADLEGFLAACASLVRPGGQMVVATIDRTPWSWLFAIVGAEYLLRWLPRGTHRWDRFRRPVEVSGILARHGLATSDLRGVRVNPLTRRFQLSRWTAVNYMLVATRSPPLG
jgi:2-polyprenyl-6-hydroxyphenyl methylase/3-demethylubiquinone-9 3-methyltransferase